jgi:hypothetical protein
MIMKNIISNTRTLLLLVLMVTLLFSCTEKLDLKPKQSIDAALALRTPENIKATLVGAYLDGRSSSIFGTAFNEYSELYASTGDMLFLGTFEQPREFIEKKASVTNSYVENTWIQAYKLINTCNMLLATETLDILDEGDRDLVEGEASEDGRSLNLPGFSGCLMKPVPPMTSLLYHWYSPRQRMLPML